MKKWTPDFLQGRSHAVMRYVKKSSEVARELLWLRIGLAVILAGFLLMEVLLGKWSEDHASWTAPSERVALVLAIAFFLLYKWRERSHSEDLHDIEVTLRSDESIAIQEVLPT